MNRRKILGLLGASPVLASKGVSTLQSKLAGEEAASQLSRLQATGLTFPSALPPTQGGPSSQADLEKVQKYACKLPWVREELKTLLFESHRSIYQIDPDLAVLKSVSLSAKIYYQRQRNVSNYLLDMDRGSYWSRTEKLYTKVRALLGLGG